MSAVLARAKAHLDSQPRGRLEVPEWGANGKPLVVTWSALTVGERQRIYDTVDGKSPGGGLVMVRTLIRKACDESGKLLFEAMAEHDLLHKVDGAVVGRIGNAILFHAGLDKPIDQAVTDSGNG